MGILAPSIYLFASPSLSHALGVSNSNKIACERMLKSLPTHIHTHTHKRACTMRCGSGNGGECEGGRGRERYSHYRA